MLLSVVIPVYNVEAYLDELLNSLLAVHSDEFEVVFVDDCSTDGSLDKISDFCERTHAISTKLIRHSRNSGLSSARNTGINQSEGEYIWFLDSDDVINYKHFSVIIDNLARNKHDVFVFDFYFMRKSTDFIALRSSFNPVSPEVQFYTLSHSGKRSLPPKVSLTHADHVLTAMMRDMRLYAWSFIFHRSLFSDLEFPVGIYFEDVGTIPSALLLANTFYYIPCELVYYRQREGSIMSLGGYKRDLDMTSAMGFNFRVFSQHVRKLSQSDILGWNTFHGQTLVWGSRDLGNAGFLDVPEISARVEKSTTLFVEQTSSNLMQICGNMWRSDRRKDAILLFMIVNFFGGFKWMFRLRRSSGVFASITRFFARVL